LDSLAGRVPAAVAATVCLLTLDPETGSIEHCSRAHPPPLIVDASGDTRFLTGGRSGPLGSVHDTVPVGRDRLTVGQALLLYSDGLIERPGRPMDESLADLATVAGAVMRERIDTDASVPEQPADRLCALVVERFAWAGYRDDVTVLVAELTPRRRRLSITVPAMPSELADVRRTIRDWLASYGVTEDDATAIQHTVGEACINAIEHAYRDRPAEAITITGDIDDLGSAHLDVADTGTWRTPSTEPGDRGRGLLLMRALADRVTVQTGPEGTVSSIDTRVHRPVLIGSANDVTSVTAAFDGAPEVNFAAEIQRGDQPTIRLRGALDPSTIEQARQAIADVRRSAPRAPVIDLSGVTHLTSVGVQLLYELRRLDEPDRPQIVAPDHSPARQILTLTGLADLTDVSIGS
jgi:anti-anti-sigma factor